MKIKKFCFTSNENINIFENKLKSFQDIFDNFFIIFYVFNPSTKKIYFLTKDFKKEYEATLGNIKEIIEALDVYIVYSDTKKDIKLEIDPNKIKVILYKKYNNKIYDIEFVS